MKRYLACSLSIGGALSMSAATATLQVTPTEPASDVVVSLPHSFYTASAPGGPGPFGERDTFTTIFPATAGTGVGARGQTFQMPVTSQGLWDVSAISVRADANTGGDGANQDLSTATTTLKLWVFGWNPNTAGNTGTQWTTGDGVGDGDPFDGTGISNFLINGQTFDITRTFSGEYLSFQTPGLQFNSGEAYGVLFWIDTSITTGFRLDVVRDGVAPNGQTYPDGALLRSDNLANSFNQNGDDLVFYIQATPVPEPSSMAFLGLGTLAITLLRRRNERA
jgi:hypothetical protein